MKPLELIHVQNRVGRLLVHGSCNKNFFTFQKLLQKERLIHEYHKGSPFCHQGKPLDTSK